MRLSCTPLALAALVTGFAACNRAPQEPAARSHVTDTGDATGDATDAAARPMRGRCIKETPATPPPAVAKGPAEGCPRDAARPGALPTVSIGVPEAEAGAITIVAELAKTDDQRERGLMFRTSMDEDHGMLFDMQTHEEHAFWMKNTCIPLDMLFVDPDGTIVGILENVPTLNLDTRTVGCPSSFVLEMNAGWARRHGVRAGQRLKLPTL